MLREKVLDTKKEFVRKIGNDYKLYKEAAAHKLGKEKRQDASRTLTGGLDSPVGHRPKEACFRVSRNRSKQETSNPYVTDARSSRLSAGGLDDILEIQERLVRCHRITLLTVERSC